MLNVQFGGNLVELVYCGCFLIKTEFPPTISVKYHQTERTSLGILKLVYVACVWEVFETF